MLERPVVVQDNSLRRTSAWGNTFLGRDHFARRAKLDVIAAPAVPATPAVAPSVAPTAPSVAPAAGPTEKGPKA
jgi:hypothetical protein